MVTKTNFLTLKLQSKGVIDISHNEVFHVWEHTSKYNVDHAVVAHSLDFEEGCKVHDILVATLHGKPMEYTRAGKSGDMNLKPYMNSTLRYGCPVATLLWRPLYYTWRFFCRMLRHGWVPFTVNLGVKRSIHAFDAYQTSSIPTGE